MCIQIAQEIVKLFRKFKGKETCTSCSGSFCYPTLHNWAICQVIVWLKNLKFDFLLSNLFLNIWLFVVLHYMIDEKVFRIQFHNMKSVFLFWLNLVYFVCFCNYGRVGKYTWYQLGLFSIKLKLMLWLILDLSIFPTYS